MVERLVEKFGEEKLKRSVVLIGQGNTLDQAFTAAFGTDYNTVLKEASDYTIVLPNKKKS